MVSSNPVATSVVRAVLETVIDDDPPRTWTRPEKELFTFLPADIRAAVSRREKQRDVEIRKLHNERADLRHEVTKLTLEARGNGLKPNESKTEGTPASNGAHQRN